MSKKKRDGTRRNHREYEFGVRMVVHLVYFLERNKTLGEAGHFYFEMNQQIEKLKRVH